jgi:hypothetical protein
VTYDAQQQPAQFQPQQPYPPGYPAGPQGYPPAPKKKHTVRNVFLVLLVLSVLGIGGCMALVGSVGNEISKGVDEEAQRNAPRDVTVGKAFSIGKHETVSGWTVGQSVGMFTVTGKFKNVSDSTSAAFVHFKFLSKTGEVLGNVQCNSSDLEPGQTQAMNCIPDGTFSKSYVKITAEATF